MVWRLYAFSKDGVFYVYHQRDTRNPAPFGEPFGWALATTTDFVNYKNFGESLKRGRDDEPDQFIYAGAYLKIKMEIFMHFTQDTIENF